MQTEPLSKRIKRGSIFLIILLLFIAFIPRINQYFSPDEKIEVIRIAKDFDENVREKEAKKVKNSGSKKGSKFQRPPSKFNPNEYSTEDWVKLGLSEKQASVISKFTANGIYSAEDFKKIFVVSDAFYQIVIDSMYFSQKPIKELKNDNIHKRIILVDLNSISEEELLEVKGIGPFYAKNILAYRTKLGGFNTKEQLLEVYRMDSTKYFSIVDYFTVDNSKIKKININNCSAYDLYVHPYISKNVANSIVKMRVNLENYSNFDQLLKSELIDKELLHKIQPYLSLSK